MVPRAMYIRPPADDILSRSREHLHPEIRALTGWLPLQRDALEPIWILFKEGMEVRDLARLLSLLPSLCPEAMAQGISKLVISCAL